MNKFSLLFILITASFPILAALIECPLTDNESAKIITARLFSVVSGDSEKAEQVPYYLSNKKYGWDLQAIENESFLLTCTYQDKQTISKKIPSNLKRCFYSQPKDELDKGNYVIVCDDFKT